LFTYHCLGLFWEKYNFKSLSAVMVYLLMLISLVGILFHYDKAYTLWTSVVLFSVLFVQKFVLKSNWLGTFFMVYFVLLIPFIIVNGLLTGSFYDQPIVWYNNGDNLGVRIGTIPMEDVFYGLQLILINVSIYEGFKRIYKTEKS
jgi:lycopene cyclase domain-containing protein